MASRVCARSIGNMRLHTSPFCAAKAPFLFSLHQTRKVNFQRSYSVRPELPSNASPTKKITIQQLYKLRASRTPITMLTAYDFSTARFCSTHGVDITFVGDSLAQVCLGLPSTTALTLDDILHHLRAVVRGTTTPLLLADMPFGTYHAGSDDAVRNAAQLIQAGAEAVKLEGGRETVDVVRRLTDVGIPVMAHIGLMPQRAAQLSGFRVQGRDATSALDLIETAVALEDAGAFAVVLEAVPRPVAAAITRRLRRAPTIGIGAGPETDGQVLVWDDVMGTWAGHKARFVRRFGDVRGAVDAGVRGFLSAVRERSFPAQEECYEMAQGELEKFIAVVGDDALIKGASVDIGKVTSTPQ